MWSSHLAVASSAMLVFLVQPIIAKLMLPHFGGTSSVWATTSVVFQLLLLLGYGYAYGLIAFVSSRVRHILHTALLILSIPSLIFFFRAGEIAERHGVDGGGISLTVLTVVAATCAMPFILLSATTPLLAASMASSDGQRLFSFSNAGSFAALLVMPIVLEPWVGLSIQSHAWAVAYVVVVIAVAKVLLDSARSRSHVASIVSRAAYSAVPALPRSIGWVGWPMLGAAFLAATNLAMGSLTPGATLVWMLPLGAYLLSFVMVFRPGGYSRQRAFPWVLVAAGLLTVPFVDPTSASSSLSVALLLFPAGLFGVCYFCHGELAALQPQSEREVGLYYVCIAFGGVLGGSIVALLLPLVLPYPTELAMLLLVLALLLVSSGWTHLPRAAVALPIILVIGVVVAHRMAIDRFKDAVVVSERNLYGLLRVKDIGNSAEDTKRLMILGGTVHGVQFLGDSKRKNATSYFGASSGAALALQRLRAARASDKPIRVAVIGLGAGVVASYCNRGDICDFFEINQAVVDAAVGQFKFLEDAFARGASINLFVGDGRRLFANLPANAQYDVVIVDVFSDGLIPTHMITREALETFSKPLGQLGILAVNVSSSTFQIAPNVARGGQSVGLSAKFVDDVSGRPIKVELSDDTYPSAWVLLSRNEKTLIDIGKDFSKEDMRLVPVWTDDFVHVFGALPMIRYLRSYF
jgi:hypothetical protein